MPFVYETTIRFAQVDPAQVVYFARVYEMAHEAFEEIMAAAGLPVGPLFQESEWGMPLVHTEADYRRPWRLGERVRIEGRIGSMTERTVEFQYAFVDETGKARTQVRMRHAFVSLDTFQARSTPDVFITAVRELDLGAELLPIDFPHFVPWERVHDVNLCRTFMGGKPLSYPWGECVHI